MITVHHLVKRFGLKVVLRNLEFQVAQGEFVALLGPNGAGKTTFLRILSSLSRPTLGQVTVAGFSLPHQAAAVRRKLGVVSHMPLLYGDLTAEENLRFYGKMYGIANTNERIIEVLNMVGLISRRRDLLWKVVPASYEQRVNARSFLETPGRLRLDPA